MPDQYMFDHLPSWGVVQHRCVVCGWPQLPTTLTEKERRKHFEEHEKKRKKEAERRQKEGLRKARQAKAQAQKENSVIEERFGS
jgi:hypothetical protein